MRFNVGDTVTIREWEDLKSSFSTVEYGDMIAIGSTLHFPYSFKMYCGQSFQIIKDSSSHYDHMFPAYNLSLPDQWHRHYDFSEDIFKESIDDSDIDTSLIDDFLGSVSCEV